MNHSSNAVFSTDQRVVSENSNCTCTSKTKITYLENKQHNTQHKPSYHFTNVTFLVTAKIVIPFQNASIQAITHAILITTIVIGLTKPQSKRVIFCPVASQMYIPSAFRSFPPSHHLSTEILAKHIWLFLWAVNATWNPPHKKQGLDY